MNKHYLFTLNPTAQYNWEQCILRNPLTNEQPDINQIVAQALGNEPGSYLVAINIEVRVLEKVAISQPDGVSPLTEVKKVTSDIKPRKLLAS